MKTKKVVLVLVAICSMCCFAACDDIPFFGKDKGKETEKSEKKRKNTSTAVVERFAKALVECDLEQAQKDSYGNLNKTFADGAQKVDTPEKKEVWKKNFLRLKDIKIDSEKIDGDSAVVVVTNGSAQTEFSLVNVNGEWKVTGMR